ncbi:HNH endonuclease signature motif containing protein [Microbacterium sp. MYb64]|uniref:HNH endonuclease signature motif containing protein n=1 Tax=Microbacterium sp. MYb64 TaxID=1848691 RepID=UPI000CFDC466|nr:HNH endonuclease signature motif containing protein [Microbacterium sp. MYb64]PRB06945.1 HNH endonuclease [Microbacterium sp. MYb64]
MTNSADTVADPGVDPVDPVTVLRLLREGLAAAEATIIRFQALRDAQLGAAQRVAEEIAARDAGAGAVRGESVDLATRSVAAELAGVLHMSDRVVQARMARAADLETRFPEVTRAFGEARINAAHVRVIQDAGARLDETVRAEFEQIAVDACAGETPHRAKRIVERVAERLAPRSLTERHREVQEQRRVWREDLGDGQKALGVIHSAAIVDGIYDRLTQQARAVSVANAQAAKDDASLKSESLGDPGDARTMDQLRADLCADTLLTGTASGHDTSAGLLSAIQARVEVTVSVLTLLTPDTAGAGRKKSPAGSGTSTGSGTAFGVRTEQPAELAGGQPIDTHTARTLAGGATAWERVLTHPVTGAILAVDHYRPNADLRRLLHARDSRCRFPTCGLPPAAQDLDHTIDAAHGGPTEEGNLGGLCRRHHILKHQTAWKVTQRGAGILEWTSPTGATYIDRPPSPVTFTVEDPDPPPEPDPETPGF